MTVFEEKITKLQPWARLVFSGLEFCRTCQISAGEETGFVYGLFTADHMERSEVKRLIGGKTEVKKRISCCTLFVVVNYSPCS